MSPMKLALCVGIAQAMTLTGVLLPVISARAEPYYRPATASLGVGFGDPTALDLKLWNDGRSGFNIGLGLERFDDIFGLYAEYELGLAAFRMGHGGARGVFYVGLGGAIAFERDDDTSIALVVPIGLDLRFEPPIDVFIEARPGVGLLDRPAFGIGGQLGVRYRF